MTEHDLNAVADRVVSQILTVALVVFFLHEAKYSEYGSVISWAFWLFVAWVVWLFVACHIRGWLDERRDRKDPAALRKKLGYDE